jgi:hypothetical protein
MSTSINMAVRSIGARARIAPMTKETVSAFVLVTVIYNLCLWYLGYGWQTQATISALDRALIFKTVRRRTVRLGVLLWFGGAAFHRTETTDAIRNQCSVTSRQVWLDIFARQPVGTYLIVVLKDGAVYNAMVTDDSLCPWPKTSRPWTGYKSGYI